MRFYFFLNCRMWDTDGREFIDYMCSYGPMIAGYGNERIQAAADAQRNNLDIATGPAPVIVELAERLVNQISHGDWAIFAKNGNDATTVCNMVARARTEKQKILVAKGAYHGAQPWANYMSKGVAAKEHAHFISYEYNNVASLQAAAETAAGDLAGIVVSAFKHDAGFDQAMPTAEFAQAARRLCDTEDAALILDEVRAGLRLSLDASWALLGIKPDLSAWGKALANGEPLAAILGAEKFREAATQIFVTGSFWYQAAPMAAAIETLDLLGELDAPTRLEALGQALRDGLYEQAQRHGHGLRQTGPAQMPAILFEDDAPDRRKGLAFCGLLIQRGVYFHPYHNMFLSTAHTEVDIQQTLAATDQAFAALGAGLEE